MKLSEQFKNPLITIHAWKCREGTNNTVFHNACLVPMNDKKLKFDAKIRSSLGLPDHVNSFYDQKEHSGAYERLWDLTVISLCSDIEFFFKELLQLLRPQKVYKFGFYQRLNDVISELTDIGFNLSSVKNELKKLIECFQVRHIAAHNMGNVDAEFLNKTSLMVPINEKFVVDQDKYKSYYDSYWSLLKCIDGQIAH